MCKKPASYKSKATTTKPTSVDYEFVDQVAAGFVCIAAPN